MLNKVMLIGRLGQDPDLRYTANGGTPVVTLNIATDESYIDKNGNKIDRTEWHKVVVFDRQAQNCANYLGKGSLVYVEGSLQTRKWQDQQGQNRYTTEIRAQRILFLDRKGEGRGGAPLENPAKQSAHGFNQSGEDLGPAYPSEVATMGNKSNLDESPF